MTLMRPTAEGGATIWFTAGEDDKCTVAESADDIIGIQTEVLNDG